MNFVDHDDINMNMYLCSLRKVMIYLIVFLGSVITCNAETPEWMGNKLGSESLVLPGYDEITKTNNGYKIGDRSYYWNKTLLVDRVDVGNKNIIHSMSILLGIDGNKRKFTLNNIEYRNVRNDSLLVIAESNKIQGIYINVEAIVEYDGLVSMKLTLQSENPISIGSLDLEVSILKSVNTNVIGYKAKNIRKQKARNDIISLPYKGDFINAFGIADGSRSFWMFADNYKNWVNNASTVTEIYESDEFINIKQRLIGDSYLVNKSIEFKINYLVTPIKKPANEWRKNRIIWGVPNDEHKKYNARYKLWWPNGLAYDAFPYVEYPGNTKYLLSQSDLNAYNGLNNNAEIIRNDRDKYSISWLPYFSAHVLSKLDPAMQQYEEKWRIKPNKTFKDGLYPYSNDFDKPVLTHNASGYSDYLLWRFDELIDQLGIDGVYLDHGPPHDSNNLHNGGWYDFNGKLRSSTDILSLRNFLKRLKTLFHIKGKPGYIFIHNSNREIIPAYTFAHGTIDGEQYRTHLSNGDYLNILSLDEILIRLSNKQYGVVNYWLPVEWTNHRGDRKWKNSSEQKQSYRKFMSLALLFDIPDWPQGSHRKERNKLLTILDDFDTTNSQFVGYWENNKCAFSNDQKIKISSYKHDSEKRIMLVIVNTDNKESPASIEFNVNNCFSSSEKDVSIYDGDDNSINIYNNQIQININAKDFKIVKMSI